MAGANRFRASEAVEEQIKSDSIQFTLNTVDIRDVNVPASQALNKRTNAVSDETVERYALKMEEGVHFPALVGYRDSDGKIILVDGVQRVTAQGVLDDTTTLVYILNPQGQDQTEKVRRVYPVLFNAMHGLALNDQEREAAVTEMIENGEPKAEVASYFGIKERQVNDLVKLHTARLKVAGAGGDTSVLSDGQIIALGKLHTSNNIKRFAGFLKRNPKTPVTVIHSIVRDVAKITDDVLRADQLDLALQELEGNKHRGQKGGTGNTMLGGPAIVGMASRLRNPEAIAQAVRWAATNSTNRKRLEAAIDQSRVAFVELDERLAETK